MPPSPHAAPKFVTGSTLRHVISMTATGSIGLAAVFFVDVLNLFYISQLGQKELAAAVGYAGTLLFFLTSMAIGLSIAATALASRALGRGERDQAKLIAGASLVLMAVFMGVAVLLVYPWLAELLGLLGARGDTATLALRFTRGVLPSAVPLGLGMCLAALLRSLGDARRAMFVTLGAGAVSAVLDPLLILGLGWGLDGAAVATVLARCSMAVIGLHALLRVHGLFAWPSAVVLRGSLRPFLAIGVPAVLTQVATPVGNAFVTAAIAPFGDNAVAGWAVIVRLIPVAFVALFALSGSVGPILGQNLGARRFDRLRSTVRDSLKVTLVYVLVVWLLMALGSGFIADAFGAQGEARELIVFFCVFVAGSFFFNGALFVANAAFNNLGFAFYSTALNWGRATLGVAPFIWIGAQWFGARGVLVGYGLGVVVFGVVGVWLSRRVLKRLEREATSSVLAPP
ncbi:MATE family efflux transporter [Hydrogenophaga sp. PBL-H3]|uniref:MATE family efflux transporter n=1 Tax=Hydrogenophaga sp. PBL-H3 TaxID=434010 RepID=UPI0013202162|nr:MATE family efflux transporter [Hydrogenophaga sp. PBL-H3]QHE76801.1 MATE family efflux transporter [Hydrogenophaga sp. PBL-H3]QHE81225.1 MATE family efflux transporter [Hydrogenophaga sp. PBL-H3]